jgi:uncharacterized protein
MVKSISRRAFLIYPVLGGATAAYARFIEPGLLEFTRRECAIPNLAKPVELAHISDLHASDVVPKSLIERAIDMAIDANPDLICITGDFVTASTGFESAWYTTLLGRLARKAPTFAVLGNHDGGEWSKPRGGFHTTAEVTRLVERSGIHLLENRSRMFVCGDTRLRITGVSDYWAGGMSAAKAFAEGDSQYPTILLSHNPDSKSVLGAHAWDLMLCGHTHGGQVVAPMLGFSPAPVEDRRYIAGMNRWQDRWIHTSRGVGSVMGVRFNCRPEVTSIRLLAA